MSNLRSQVKDLAYNPDHTRWIAPLLLIADAGISGVVIDRVPCKPSQLHIAAHKDGDKSQHKTCLKIRIIGREKKQADEVEL